MKNENYLTPDFTVLEVLPETDSCTSMGGTAETYGIDYYEWENQN